MTASKRVYEPVAASLRQVYRQAVEMYAEGRKDEAVTLYNALTGIVGDVKTAFWQDNIHFSGHTFQEAVYGVKYVYGVWHGGPSYSSGGDFRDNMERWDDLDDAKESLRYRDGGHDYYGYVTETGLLDVNKSGWFDSPAVTRDSYIDLYKSWYDGLEWLVDDQPYGRIVFGPRGGRRVESF